MAVPQHAFVSAQPVGRAAVVVSARNIAAAPISSQVAVAPTRESVLGSRAGTANRVAAPPVAIANRQVIAKRMPPPPPVPFAKQQQALAAHPGEPLARSEVRTLRPANTAEAHPMVKQAPPGRPATPNAGRMGNQPGSQTNAARPSQPYNPPVNQPVNRPGNPTAPVQANHPVPAQPNNRPEVYQPGNHPESNRPEPNRPPVSQPSVRPEATHQGATRPEASQPPPQHQQPKAQTPEEKKQEQERQKKEPKPQGE
jgi:hypothetical protein